MLKLINSFQNSCIKNIIADTICQEIVISIKANAIMLIVHQL